MPELFLHGREITTLFDLLGQGENDITYSLGWALSRSEAFLNLFLKETVGFDDDASRVTVRLQHYRKNEGITDIEIELAHRFHIIVEAKRGWNLPTISQLKKYASRLTGHRSSICLILVLSECSSEYAEHHLPCRTLRGIPVRADSWQLFFKMIYAAMKSGGNTEKHLLDELSKYLGRVTTVRDIESNWVYVVSLNSGTRKGWGVSSIDVVEKRNGYFHPMGIKGWPKEPPNYIAFRYGGKLQTIRHVDSYSVITNLHEAFQEIPSKEREPHFLYKLGPSIVPSKTVKAGGLYSNGRVWCMVDTLLTCNTIADALNLSKKRSRLANQQG